MQHDPGRFRRLAIDLPREAEEAIKFYSTADNWVFNPYEAFEIDTKPIEAELAALAAVYNEAAHGLDSGQMPVAEARAMMTKLMDEAGRQTVKTVIQKQFDDWRVAHPQS